MAQFGHAKADARLDGAEGLAEFFGEFGVGEAAEVGEFNGFALFDGEFGRIRDVVVAPDGALLMVTDEEDGAILRVSKGATQ